LHRHNDALTQTSSRSLPCLQILRSFGFFKPLRRILSA
jgi:hypothetical protein